MKENGQMMFSCGWCDGCIGIPITKDQYDRILRQLIRSQSISDKELAEKFVTMQIFLVKCKYKSELVLTEYRGKGLL